MPALLVTTVQRVEDDAFVEDSPSKTYCHIDIDEAK